MIMDVLLSPIRLDDFESLIAKTVKQALADLPSPTIQGDPSDELLCTEEAAEFLGIAVPTLYGLVSADKISSMKPGKKLYFLKADLINYIKSSRRCSKMEMAELVERNLTGSKAAA